ncbi:hypothetical protein J1G42_02700 [Cellulomonas sp. zg-ZUI222]|uniref:hypothetical protein n=1 Tax=Cellulomonas wangleii TaxID=2816956 RepID=UPI001A940A1F|nr:hypothetical protein [Cellulomonas wangleii]MBO0919734.1 hypothetical protein [Cellulomonas wangleii]
MSSEDPSTTPHGTGAVPPPPPPGPPPLEPFAAPDVPPAPPGTVPHGGPVSPYGAPAASPYGGPAANPYQVGGAPYGTPGPPAATYGPGAPSDSPHDPAGSSPWRPPGTTPPSTDPTGAHPLGPDPAASPPGAPWGPVAPPTRNGLAVAALVLAIIAFVMAWVPVANVVAVLLGLVALVLGIVSIARGRGAGRKVGAGVAGVVVGTLATVVGFTTLVVYELVSTTEVVAEQVEEHVEPERPGAVPGEDLPGGAQPDEQGGERADEQGAGDDAQAGTGPAAAPLQVADIAFGPDPLDEGSWWFVVTVDNPNPDHRYDSAEMSVEAIAADGTLIAARPQYLTALPGRTAITGTFRELGGMTPDRVEVRLPAVQRGVVHAPGGGALTTSTPVAEASSWGTTITGTVTSSLAEDVEMALVVVVATDPAGTVVGAERGYVELVPAGGEGPFEIDFYDELPAGTQFTAYATP